MCIRDSAIPVPGTQRLLGDPAVEHEPGPARELVQPLGDIRVLGVARDLGVAMTDGCFRPRGLDQEVGGDEPAGLEPIGDALLLPVVREQVPDAAWELLLLPGADGHPLGVGVRECLLFDGASLDVTVRTLGRGALLLVARYEVPPWLDRHLLLGLGLILLLFDNRTILRVAVPLLCDVRAGSAAVLRIGNHLSGPRLLPSPAVLGALRELRPLAHLAVLLGCLLYTSDAADEEDSVDLGGRRIIKKKKKKNRKR
eukprot:TRINITY_DN14534_c0_g1_i14.p1 TRINITY_DN14534_c0_g1~~TRINITY_DN14534_c0_g1_i14.p1  ORF type:complete len:255 (-),score=46.72 TRINITY_DN14534_c0_g1_i14:58-822(-)